MEVQLTNVVPAPFFSAKTFSQTSLQEWKDEQRHHLAPWADFESDKYMMQVPTSWIYNYDDPVTLMQDWDDRMDVVSNMLGYPLIRNNTILYLQVDVDIMYGFYGIGNPQINNTYNPLQPENGNKNHWFLRPGDSFWETEFHEMGHAQLFSKFPGRQRRQSTCRLRLSTTGCMAWISILRSVNLLAIIHRSRATRLHSTGW
ncbi:MAG: hypothetical protein IPP25_17935 [Saprospiraceae bacterium]|nr:hypothetical protein [Candidatus Opimibacter skivensis]